MGIDISEEMVALAKEKRQLDNISYQTTSLEQPLPFEADSFDLVFSNMVMHYIENLDQTAAELHRVLKSKGTLLFSTQNSTFDRARFDFLRETTERTKFATKDSLKGKVSLERYFEPNENLIQHFLDAGFVLEATHHTIIFDDFIEIYPRYKNYVGLPRFLVLKFRKL